MAHPRGVFGLVLAAVVLAGLACLRLQVDTAPENMLPADQAERLFHRQAKSRFDLRDALVVGVVGQGLEGIYTPAALGRVRALTPAVRDIDGVVAKDVLSLATVDDVRPDGPGTARFSWLMQAPPATQAEAEAVREAVARMPMFLGSLVSDDGQAAAIHGGGGLGPRAERAQGRPGGHR